jgi:integrase/recombinase XerD
LYNGFGYAGSVMLSVYTRHSSACDKKADNLWKRCRCPKWINGMLGDTFMRRSAKTRSWEKAELEVRRLERQEEDRQAAAAQGLPPKAEKATRLLDAVDRFLASKEKQNLAPATLVKLRNIFQRQLLSWAQKEGIRYVSEIDIEGLERFRHSWEDGPLARKKKQERVIGFFYYCLRMGWIAQNPAANLGRVIADAPPTICFSKEEFETIIDATYIYNPKAWNTEPRNQATRLRVLLQLLRWSGLSIRDAITLERTRLNDNDELFLYRAKTGVPVYVPLPSEVAESLRNVPSGVKPNSRYFFWSGNGDPKTAVADWQRSFRRLAEIANLREPDGSPKRCHFHMIRDTFAVELLLAGVTMDQVSLLLGHKSIRTTEKHYAPFVKARQEQLAASVRRTWITPVQTAGEAKSGATRKLAHSA